MPLEATASAVELKNLRFDNTLRPGPILDYRIHPTGRWSFQ